MSQLLNALKSVANMLPYISSIKLKFLWGVYFRRVSKKVSGFGNFIGLDTFLLWRLKIRVSGNSNKIIIDRNSVIKNLSICISGDNNNIYIGCGVVYKAGLILIEGSGNKLTIGPETTIEHAEFHITEKNCLIEIGADCMLSDRIIFRNGDSHPIYDKASKQRLNRAGSISIGNHVWIAQDVLFLKNSTIPSGSIVGSRSLVNKEFYDECSIIAGSPARTLRSNIVWKRDRE